MAQPFRPAATSYIHLLLCSGPFDCPERESHPRCNFRNHQFFSGLETSLNEIWPWDVSRRECPSSETHIDSALHPAAVQCEEEQPLRHPLQKSVLQLHTQIVSHRLLVLLDKCFRVPPQLHTHTHTLHMLLNHMS